MVRRRGIVLRSLTVITGCAPPSASAPASNSTPAIEPVAEQVYEHADADGVGWRIRDNVYESVEEALRVRPLPGWRLLAPGERSSLLTTNGVGLLHERHGIELYFWRPVVVSQRCSCAGVRSTSSTSRAAASSCLGRRWTASSCWTTEPSPACQPCTASIGAWDDRSPHHAADSICAGMAVASWCRGDDRRAGRRPTQWPIRSSSSCRSRRRTRSRRPRDNRRC